MLMAALPPTMCLIVNGVTQPLFLRLLVGAVRVCAVCAASFPEVCSWFLAPSRPGQHTRSQMPSMGGSG